MSLKKETLTIDKKVLEKLLEGTLGPVDVLRGNSDLLLLPIDLPEGNVLGAHTIDICTRLISKGIVAKMVVKDGFRTQYKDEGTLCLPPIMVLDSRKERVIMDALKEWAAEQPPGRNIVRSLIISKEAEGYVLMISTGTLRDVFGR